jgi:hypothetical protein
VSTSDNDRIAYLAGEDVASLTPQERAELDELRSLLETPATWEEPDPGLEDRVVSAIADAARSQGGLSTAPELPPEAQKETKVERRRTPFSLRSLFRRPIVGLGALATAAAAVAVIVAISGNANSTSPLRFAMVISGTPLAPNGHGSATLTKMTDGWRIDVSATGLPRRANGLYYQAWLKNAAGTLVPVGTFNNARHVTLWSGVPVTQFRTLTVTQQVANGNPASSHRVVLVGTIRPAH